MKYILFDTKTETIIEEEILENEKSSQKYSLIIFNDDYNTFEHVINCLIEICHHELVQAEQCTHIIHFKGKCCVKSGDLKSLERMNAQLLSKGLSSLIVNK